MSRAQIEQRLSEYLGVEHIVWLGRGIAGDDTDGHIDDFARFIGESSIAIVGEEDSEDANFGILRENRERLAELRIAGQPVTLIDLPMPRPILARGERLPASYANFYIANNVVLLPVFSDPADAVAAAILAPQFPSRLIVPIDARALVHGLGGIHCLTQQVPADSQ
jgi:agmatine deiminase